MSEDDSLLRSITHDAAGQYAHLNGVAELIERGGEIDRVELVSTLHRCALRAQMLSFLARGSLEAYEQAERLLAQELVDWDQRGRPSVVKVNR